MSSTRTRRWRLSTCCRPTSPRRAAEVAVYQVQPMQLADVDEVSRVERECFTTPWPVNAYRRELRENRLSRYVVVRWSDEGSAAQVASGSQGGPLDDDPFGGVRRAVSSLLRPFGLTDRPTTARGASPIL